MNKYAVVTVSSINARDKLVKTIYTNIKNSISIEPNLIAQQDQVNQVKVFHKTKGGLILIKTYLVIVIPVTINLSQLYGVEGDVTFQLHETIKDIETLLNKLKSLQGHRIMKGNTNNESTLEQLVRSLS